MENVLYLCRCGNVFRFSDEEDYLLDPFFKTFPQGYREEGVLHCPYCTAKHETIDRKGENVFCFTADNHRFYLYIDSHLSYGN